MKKLKFTDDLKTRLKDSEYAPRFLETVLEDGDIRGLDLALRLVADARGVEGKPTIKNPVSVARGLGFKIRFDWEKSAIKKPKPPAMRLIKEGEIRKGRRKDLDR